MARGPSGALTALSDTPPPVSLEDPSPHPSVPTGGEEDGRTTETRQHRAHRDTDEQSGEDEEVLRRGLRMDVPGPAGGEVHLVLSPERTRGRASRTAEHCGEPAVELHPRELG